MTSRRSSAPGLRTPNGTWWVGPQGDHQHRTCRLLAVPCGRPLLRDAGSVLRVEGCSCFILSAGGFSGCLFYFCVHHIYFIVPPSTLCAADFILSPQFKDVIVASSGKTSLMALFKSLLRFAVTSMIAVCWVSVTGVVTNLYQVKTFLCVRTCTYLGSQAVYRNQVSSFHWFCDINIYEK